MSVRAVLSASEIPHLRAQLYAKSDAATAGCVSGLQDGTSPAGARRTALGRLENNLSLMDPQGEKTSPDLRLIGVVSRRLSAARDLEPRLQLAKLGQVSWV